MWRTDVEGRDRSRFNPCTRAHLEGVGAQRVGGLLLAQAHAAVFEGREDRGGHARVVHLLRGAPEEAVVCCVERKGVREQQERNESHSHNAMPQHAPAREEDAGLDGHGRQLGLPLHHVAHRIDVRERGLLERAEQLARGRVHRQAHARHVERAQVRVPPAGREDRVKDVLLPRGEAHAEAAPVRGLHRHGQDLGQHPHARLRLQVPPHARGALAIEAAQEDGAHQHRHLLREPNRTGKAVVSERANARRPVHQCRLTSWPSARRKPAHSSAT